MNYRITLADSVYYTRDELAAAQSEALDHARELTRVVGRPVRVTVHKMGQLVMDEFGRDVTPALFVGSAVGRLERSNAFEVLGSCFTPPCCLRKRRIDMPTC